MAERNVSVIDGEQCVKATAVPLIMYLTKPDDIKPGSPNRLLIMDFQAQVNTALDGKRLTKDELCHFLGEHIFGPRFTTLRRAFLRCFPDTQTSIRFLDAGIQGFTSAM